MATGKKQHPPRSTTTTELHLLANLAFTRCGERLASLPPGSWSTPESATCELCLNKHDDATNRELDEQLAEEEGGAL